MALPVVHCAAEYHQPLVCGDRLAIELHPRQLEGGGFEVCCVFLSQGRSAACATLRHVAINAERRERCPLPEALVRWLDASRPAAGPGAG